MGSHFGDTTQIASILDRLRAGDERARNELLLRTQQRLRFLAERVCKGFPGVPIDEALSGANFRLLKSLAEVHPASVVDFMRWAACQMQRELIDLIRVRSRYEPLSDDPIDQTVGPLEYLLRAEFRGLIEKMEPQDRDVVSLRIYDDLTFREIAELLDESESIVQRRWHKAALKLHGQSNS